MGKTTPTYQNLFGTDAFYTVDPARSVLSPAAYFVELMRLKEQNITISSPGLGALKSRRPDLWKITLDAKNTNTEISKLEIINTVLKNALNVTDNDLAKINYPFNLPYNQPLSEIRYYLFQNISSLPKLWKDFSPSNTSNSRRKF